MNKQNLIVSAVVALVVSLAFWLVGHVSSSVPPLGGRIETVLNTFGKGFETTGGASVIKTNSTLAIGTSGSPLAFAKIGTCSILANVSIVATTTKNFDCAFTGAISGDTVMAHFNASSTLARQFVITGFQASSTSDWITFSILNLSGAAANPAATVGFGSSTQILILR